MKKENNAVITEQLPVLSLRGLVVYPGMMLHFDVGRKKSILALNKAMHEDQRILLIPQTDIRDDDPPLARSCPIGVVAVVKQVLKQTGEGIRILVEGQYRANVASVLHEEPFVLAEASMVPSKRGNVSRVKVNALMRMVRSAFEEYASLAPKLAPDVILGVKAFDEPGDLADYIASSIMLEYNQKQELLCELNEYKRLEKLLTMLTGEIGILGLEKEISIKVKEQIDENQKEYYLREQMKVISDELGEADSPQDEAEEFMHQIDALTLPDEVREKLQKECARLSKMPYGSHEANVVRNYLEACIELPWNKESKINIDVNKAQKVLDRDHYGMKKVKERIVDMLAVRKLSPEMKGQIICLVGPPGVGKTSVAKSVARAVGCEYVRIALGGVKDESEIRGHRKTYIGAMPGRIIAAVKQAGVKNPLILLDEIDKLSNDFRGDPTSALLEVLDAEQNSTFHDHYIDLPFDLSGVLFITTANDYSAIPAPLLDRMDVIELPSYTAEEKFHIAKRHLIPKQIKKHGVTARQFRLTDEALRELIDGYTREAGVRTLERTIATLLRKSARSFVSGEKKSITVTQGQLEEMLGPRKYKRDEPEKTDQVGVVTGLAWTSVGGETMPIEVAVMDGTGKIELTGSLGDVMKESAKIAISCIRCRSKGLNIRPDFYQKCDIHIHAPEGAVPKDGPSAGVTMATAMVSSLSGTPVRHDVAMTGEITLRGKVLPIGGLREKTMAAYRNGVKTVVVPLENKPDLEEVDDVVKESLRFVFADSIDTVFETALCFDAKKEAASKADSPIPPAELGQKPGGKPAYISQ